MTGASGFIGAPLMAILARQGNRLFALPSPRFRAGRLAGVQYETVRAAGEARAEVVYHLAGPPLESGTGPGQTEAIAGGMARLLDDLRSYQPSRLIVAGSAAEYGSGHGWREDDEPNPDTLFGQLKREAGEAAAASGIASVIRLRVFTPFGPGEPASRLIPSAVRAACAGTRLRLRSTGEQTRDYVPVEDVAEAFALAAVRPRGSGGAVINICSGVARTALAVAKRVFELAGRSPDEVESGTERAGALTQSSGNRERACQLLQWRPRPGFDAALTALIEASKESGTW